MAILKVKDLKKMTEVERTKKIEELRFELVKSNVTANKTNAKNKEIKRTIARLITFNKQKSKEVDKKN